jgi:glycosyltransferase involved in cell wall biosynthesis
VPGARLVVVGGGEQAAALAVLVRARGLDDAVELVGGVGRDEATAHLAAADVFCLPSTYEGLPLAILEAMAAGLPVVATAVSGNPEAVEHGRSGLLVPAESARALAEALVALLNDPTRRRAMGAEGRRRARERFAIDRVAAEHLRLLRRLAGAPATDGQGPAPAP